MNSLKVFEYEGDEVRAVLIEGEFWFVGKDVAAILGYQNPSEALQMHVDKEDKLDSKTLLGFEEQSLGQRGGWFINESGLYSIILSSKLPAAKEFKRWVTSQVLPSIRKTGGYVNNDELFISTYLTHVDEETKAIFRSSLKAIRALGEKVDTLEIALNESIKFYTVAKYNKVFNMGWPLKKCQEVGKGISVYCRSRAIEVRKCKTNDERFGEVNSYPLTAWEDFLHKWRFKRNFNR